MHLPDPERLIKSLAALPRETEWVEFKRNKFDAEEVGRYISGLANAAMLHNQPHAYLIFGVDDKSHEIVGTTVDLKAEKVGSEPFEPWLSRLLHPPIHVEFHSATIDHKNVQFVRINPAYLAPSRFKNEAYVRVDTALKPLRDHQERERALWAVTSRFSFEQGIALANLNDAAVFENFEVEKLLEHLDIRRTDRGRMIERLLAEKLLVDNLQGSYDATNLLALLAARDLRAFPALRLKSARTIHYSGTSKTIAKDDRSGQIGFGISFVRMLAYVMERIDHKEEMQHGVRRTVFAIPEISLREFIANALIHQDLTQSGRGPTIEIYSDRVRITNPGQSLIEPDRMIDAPARSRNEELSSFMRRLGLFEGRGSGIDRAIEAIEKAALRPPLFQNVDDSMVVTVYAARSFAAMSKDDRVRACYQHACVRWEAGLPMSNQSLRDRFGLSKAQYPQASLVIADAKDRSLIKPQDEEQANRVARYLPYWA